MDKLQEQIDYWSGFGVRVNWFVNADRTEAIAIGGDGEYGFIWSVAADGSTSEATLKNWTTGIEI